MINHHFMGGFIDIASGILSQTERQVEINAQNISNIATPGYKRNVSFSRLLAATDAQTTPRSEPSISPDLSPGKLLNTGRSSDLAIAGRGFFAVSSQNGVLYTRQGQFNRDSSGHLVTATGLTLQAQGGGDLTLKDGDFKVLEDGSVTQNGEPVAKLNIVDIADTHAAVIAQDGAFSVASDKVTALDAPSVHQGMLESSNVSMGTEMVSIMGALRRAETGQRLVTVYDDLMGRVLSIFGQAS